MAINFTSIAGHHLKQRLELLLREKPTVGADIDQLYRQIIATSENVHCRMLASIIHLHGMLPLAGLRHLFHGDQETLAVTLEVFSPVILNPSNGTGNVEIYHVLRDPQRSEDYYVTVDDAHVHEHLAICCLNLLTRNNSGGLASFYASASWGRHLSKAYPSSRLRDLLALFTKGTFFA
ncbi:hypothetical protein M405DRAFT_867431 [Rhizopogon salebrosus TDB-379]|nr:hypothetical protein M405DRAFT_867431 [Rhizopogon salebrosus TDB-379]